MVVRIRLKRIGKIRHSIYRVVVVNSRRKRDGRVIEEAGKYDPNQEPPLTELELERIQYWLGAGTWPSDTVHCLLMLSNDWAKLKGAKNVENRIRARDGDDDIAATIKAADDAIEKVKAKKVETEAETEKEAGATKATAESEKAAEEILAEETPAEEKAG